MSLSLFDLTGQRVLITGSSQGIGFALAMGMAAAGAEIILNGRDASKLAQAAKDLGGTVQVLAFDVTDHDAVRAAVDAFETESGPIDILINNAGIATEGWALAQSASDFDNVMAVNVRGVWLMAVAVARRWRDARSAGIVVNIASVLGERVATGVGPYAVSKAGVIQMTKALALEWARHGIRVNAIAPGYFATDINAAFFESDAGQGMMKRIPMRRIGNLEELDGILLLLATDASSFMTGAVIPVDGGPLVSSL